MAAIPEVSNIKIVNLKVFMKHTSASLTINENADYKVRNDFRVILYVVLEKVTYYNYKLKVMIICLLI